MNNKEQKFEWSDDNVKEFIRQLFDRNTLPGLPHEIEIFKQSKQQSVKDWEIISFKDDCWEYKLMDWQKYPCYSTPHYEAPGRQMSLDYAIESKAKIHSVKRLSDGEVFTIDNITNQGRITGFHLEGGGMIAEFEGNSRHCHINLLEHAKQPLFKTEDGVDIYDKKTKVVAVKRGKHEIFTPFSGDGLGVWLNGWYTTEFLPNPKEDDTEEIISLINHAYIIFSTEEAAREYILLNKPVLSLFDFQNCALKYGLPPVGLNNDLKELAQSKITKP